VPTEEPGAPTNLTEVGKTSNSISLSWTAPTNGGAVEEYEVWYKTGESDYVKLPTDGSGVPTVAITGTVAVVSGLAPETTYTFKVVATNTVGSSETASNELSVTTTAEGASDHLPPVAGNPTTPLSKTDLKGDKSSLATILGKTAALGKEATVSSIAFSWTVDWKDKKGKGVTGDEGEVINFIVVDNTKGAVKSIGHFSLTKAYLEENVKIGTPFITQTESGLAVEISVSKDKKGADVYKFRIMGLNAGTKYQIQMQGVDKDSKKAKAKVVNAATVKYVAPKVKNNSKKATFPTESTASNAVQLLVTPSAGAFSTKTVANKLPMSGAETTSDILVGILVPGVKKGAISTDAIVLGNGDVYYNGEIVSKSDLDSDAKYATLKSHVGAVVFPADVVVSPPAFAAAGKSFAWTVNITGLTASTSYVFGVAEVLKDSETNTLSLEGGSLVLKVKAKTAK